MKDSDKYEKTEDLPECINVATSFPNIAKDYFKSKGKTAKIIEVSGAVEITPNLGLSDVVVDITSTGSTLKSNRLKIIDKNNGFKLCYCAKEKFRLSKNRAGKRLAFSY